MSIEATRRWLLENTRNRFGNPQQAYSLVNSALTQFPSLQPKIAEYIADTGGTRQALLCLHGTLPVAFNGVTFNIPVVFWFPRGFPEHSPLAYVTPTRAMVVKVSKHVDERGRVYHPYLAGWDSTSTLNELFASLIAVFSAEPPVFSRPPGYSGAAIKPASRPDVGSVSMMSLPTVSMPMASAGAMSMSSLPQSAAITPGFMPNVRPSPSGSLPSAFVRPVTASEKELAGVAPLQPRAQVSVSASASVDSAEQGLGKMAIASDSHVMTASPVAVSDSETTAPQPAPYTFNPVPGRPPVPKLNPMAGAPQSPGSTASEHVGSPVLASSQPANRLSIAEPDLPSNGDAEVQQAPLTLQTTDSSSTVSQSAIASAAAALSAHSTHSTQSVSTAAVSTPTTAVNNAPLGRATETAAPKSPVASSLLDYEPMDDPQKRLVGFQLAIYDRVTDAVNKSREKHTRVNKELLDQSANLNSGAGVIAEERHQLLESQRQLAANISVLEHKLNELNEKKAEFPDAKDIADVRTVFCGQTPAMEQLFGLAGEIAAIDDTLYALGKALNDGLLPLNTYMRQVRKLAQQQFMAKALALKIRGLCGLK
ncbi:suppressor protein stp22 of temperature-sensitive alpha-factor receptor and arginine permease [Coemansia sp. RSA 1822]|nr:suppressor protein stp22 of temperature-sensitive alpha-factor receptor and arginine permease [Coemansia sp. RSA 638]KAJ2543507.1 suppressor protein stp22 of temperature-sensitive alpha-factor receptor and arginine permease [Coemansia sp. RSA 1853]KAJ2565346.1 suppressor protein stp22 of temperature-sensitive alpha-factor receptor and arginine permease [Coemansia sp. RSA 1822]